MLVAAGVKDPNVSNVTSHLSILGLGLSPYKRGMRLGDQLTRDIKGNVIISSRHRRLSSQGTAPNSHLFYSIPFRNIYILRTEALVRDFLAEAV